MHPFHVLTALIVVLCVSCHISFADACACANASNLLRAFYNATGGASWNRPWDVRHLVGGDPCTWEGVRCLGGLITEIALENRNLQGTLPTELSELRGMQKFVVLRNSGLSGTIPDAFSQWVDLQYIDLRFNRLTGTLPWVFGYAWKRVSILMWNGNDLGGTLPESYGQMRMLKKLELTDNPQITGTLPETYTDLSQLYTLHISNARLVGTLPHSYGAAFPLMANFNVANNSLHGTLPASFALWTNLIFFSVHYNAFSGTLPEAFLSSWPAVTSINIHHNELEGTFPNVRGWGALDRFSCNSNKFSGPLPEAASAWRQATEVAFSANAFTGTLPAAWSSCINMMSFDAGANRLFGTIPESWAAWKNMTIFSVGNNRLASTLPEFLASSWPKLVSLSMDLNAFYGTLPASYSALSQLQQLSLSQNLLSGTLPLAWERLRLSMLNVQDNSGLRGPVPSSWVNIISRTPFFGIMTVCRTQICGSPALLNQYQPGFVCFKRGDSAARSESTPQDAIIRMVSLGTTSLTTPCWLPSPTPTPSPSLVEEAPDDDSFMILLSTVNVAAVSAVGAAWISMVTSTARPLSAVAAPTMASSMQGVVGVFRLRSRCNAQSSSSSLDDTTATALTMLENPTQMRFPIFGDDDVADAAGVVVGNCCLTVGIGLVLHGAARLVRYISRKHDLSKHQWSRVFIHLVDTEARVPATMVVPFQCFVLPTVSASVVLLSAGAEAIPLGILGLGAWTAPWIVFAIVVCLARTKRISLPLRCGPTIQKRPARRRWYCRYVEPCEQWRLHSTRALWHCFLAFVESYREALVHFPFFEVGMPILSGALLGIGNGVSDAAACATATAVGSVLVCLSGGMLFLHLRYRPHTVPLEEWVSIVGTTMGGVGEFLGTVDAGERAAAGIAIAQLTVQSVTILMLLVLVVCESRYGVRLGKSGVGVQVPKIGRNRTHDAPLKATRAAGITSRAALAAPQLQEGPHVAATPMRGQHAEIQSINLAKLITLICSRPITESRR